MRRIQIVKKLFFKLSDFERVRSHVLQCYESSVLQRNGNNNNLVPVTFPVKAVFPDMHKCLKPLVAALELRWDSNENFGMPKGDSTCLVRWCSPMSIVCWKHPCSVRRRCCTGCCTASSCTAVFEGASKPSSPSRQWARTPLILPDPLPIEIGVDRNEGTPLAGDSRCLVNGRGWAG